MLALVAVMAWGPDPPVAQTRLDPAVWWYVARASGLLAWALLGASVTGGLLLSTRLTRGHTRTWTQELHEFVGVLAVVFTAIHLIADELRIGLRELLVPFARPDNPVAQGSGALAFYLLTVVVLTSWARALLPWRWWWRLHLLAFPLFALACTHTVLAGSDTTQPIVHWASLAVGVVILFLAAFRLLTARPAGISASPDPPRPATPPPALTSVGTGMRLLITQTTWEADNVLALPSGRRRQYSLCGDPDDTRSYRIAILQVAEGRGGSVEVHTGARAGQLLTVARPRNHFALIASPAYLFIAGGIGITAMLAMAARIATAGGEWKLVYTGRRRTGMAFIDEVRALGTDRVDVMPKDERGRPDLGRIIGAALPGTAVYCCGPDRLLHDVRERVAVRPDLSLHSERFTGTVASGTAASDGAAFRVELRRTGSVIDVPADRTVLHAVRDVLPAVPAGCEQGVCGACRTTVLAGEPDHRDELLTRADRAAGAMLICVSRAHSERLILDL